MTEILRMTNLKIEGFSDEQWVPIVKGVDVTLKKGEVLGFDRGVRRGKIDHRSGFHELYPDGMSHHRRFDCL